MPYSYNITGDTFPGGTISVPFPYLDRSHVHVEVGGTAVSSSLFEWTSNSLLTALAGFPIGQTKVYRATPIDSLDTTLTGVSVFDYQGVNRTHLRLLYAIQEAIDRLGDIQLPGASDLSQWTTIYEHGGTGLGYPFNDRDAFQAALNSGKNVYVTPAKNGARWFLRGSLNVPSGTTVVFLRGAGIEMMNDGGRGIRWNSHTRGVDIDILLHGNKAYQSTSDFTRGAGAVWIGDLYPPNNVDGPLYETVDVTIRGLRVLGSQFNPDGTQNAFSVHGVSIWGPTRLVDIEQFDMRGRYISYFLHADWGTSQPRVDRVTGEIHPYDDISHPFNIRLANGYIEGDYSWVFPAGHPNAGKPVAVNGLSSSNARMLVMENIHIKNIAEAVWVKIGDGGTSISQTDIPRGSELAGIIGRNITVENARNFGFQVINKSYDDNEAGRVDFGADIEGMSVSFERCRIIRGPNELEKGFTPISLYFTANIYADIDVIWPPDVTILANRATCRVLCAKNIELRGKWMCNASGLDMWSVIGLKDFTTKVNPYQDRVEGYAWPVNHAGVNLFASRSPTGSGATTTIAANGQEGDEFITLASVPWDIQEHTPIFTPTLTIYVEEFVPAGGSPVTVSVEPLQGTVTSGTTVYQERVVLAAAEAVSGARQITVNQVPFPLVSGSMIYTGSQIIELDRSQDATTSPTVLYVKGISADIALGDPIQLEKTVKDITITSRMEGFKTGVNVEGSGGSTPTNIEVTGSSLHRMGLYGVFCDGGANVNIRFNNFDKGNRSNNSSNGSNIYITGTPGDILIIGNTFERVFSSRVRFNIRANNSSKRLKIVLNTFNGYDLTKSSPACLYLENAIAGEEPAIVFGNDFPTGYTAILPTAAVITTTVGAGKIGFGSASPTGGRYSTGDIIFNRLVAGPDGWYCSSGGSPGTWTAFDLDSVPLSGGTMTGLLTISIATGGSNQLTIRGQSTVGFIAERYSDNTSQPINILRKARGVIGGPTVVAQNDILGELQYAGHSGSGFVNAAAIRGTVIAGTPGTGDMQARLGFFMCPAGSASMSEVARLEYDTGLSMYGANVVIDQNRIVKLRQYTKTTLPTGVTGGLITVSNDVGGYTVSFYNGTNWVRVQDLATIS